MKQLFHKGETYCWFSGLCARCALNYTCVAASRISLTRQEYIESQHGRTKQTPAMARGTLLHEQYSAAIPTIGQLTPKRYKERLLAGEEVVLKEVPVCMQLHNGFRGHIDILKVKREESGVGPQYYVTIQENKSTHGNVEWRKKWLRQLTVYSLIFASPVANWVHAGDLEWFRIYPDEEPVINIRSFLHFFDGSPEFPDGWFMRNNKIEERWMHLVFSVYAQARRKRLTHRRGLYLLSLPEEEPKQLYLGQRKLLVQSPPHTTLRSNFP